MFKYKHTFFKHLKMSHYLIFLFLFPFTFYSKFVTVDKQKSALLPVQINQMEHPRYKL